MGEAVTTPEQCVAYIEKVGICSWRIMSRLPGFPSLEAVTPWRGSEVTFQTWFWKDDLHIEKRLCYAKLLDADTPAFVSMAFLPNLIAAQGDNDPQTLHEQGRLSQMAFDLYRHIECNGPTASSLLPWRPGSRQMYLVALERRFLITKHALTGRTRGTYGYIWGKADDFYPDAFAAAEQISVSDAREQVRSHLAEQGIEPSPVQAARLFRWSDT